MNTHTVEKIGGTSMSRFGDVLKNVLAGNRKESELYNRIIVVSAYSGITDLLLEHKKSSEPGVYGMFAEGSSASWAWGDAITKVAERMLSINAEMEPLGLDRAQADLFVRERIEGIRSCLIDLQRLCSYGHFQLSEHLMTIREMLSAVGEAHSANNSAIILQNMGINARFSDLTGWREEDNPLFESKIRDYFQDIDLTSELPIVTGYTQCREGLMHTYDRGYSEITFSKIAEVTKAKEAVIHKEFHLSSGDPNIVGEDKVQTIGETNYDVADQLSDMGMEAIHPGAAKGLRRSGVGLRIKNSFEPEHPGTIITDGYRSREPAVEIIAGRKKVLGIQFWDQDMVGRRGYDSDLCRALDKMKLRYVAKATNANTVTHYLDCSLQKAKTLIASLLEKWPDADITVCTVALLSAIGSNMAVPGILGRAVSSLEGAGVDILGCHKGSREVEIKFMVPQSDYEKSLCALHQALVEKA